jgi:hypothetical protein
MDHVWRMQQGTGAAGHWCSRALVRHAWWCARSRTISHAAERVHARTHARTHPPPPCRECWCAAGTRWRTTAPSTSPSPVPACPGLTAPGQGGGAAGSPAPSAPQVTRAAPARARTRGGAPSAPVGRSSRKCAGRRCCRLGSAAAATEARRWRSKRGAFKCKINLLCCHSVMLQLRCLPS